MASIVSAAPPGSGAALPHASLSKGKEDPLGSTC